MMATFVDYTIRMSLVLALALLGVRLLRRQSAALRHLILTAAVFCAAVLPVFNRALPPLEWNPRVEMPALPAPVERVVKKSIAAVIPQQAAPAPVRSLTSAGPSREEAPAAEAVAVPASRLSRQAQKFVAPPPEQSIKIVVVLWGIYVAGTAISFSLLLLSLVRLARIGLRARAVQEARWQRLAGEISQDYRLRRPLQLLESSSPPVLATWGLFRPRIVIPSGATDWSEDRIRVVLGHELAHIRRQDWFVQLCAEAFRAVFWFNPLAWRIRRRLRQESEHACDDAVLNRGVPASEYASHLLDLARALGTAEPAWAPALLMARGSTLEQRFEAMLNPRLKRNRVSGRTVVLTFGAFLCVAAPLAALRAAPQAAAAKAYVQETAVNTANTVRSAVMAVLQVQPSQIAAPVPNSIEGLVVRLGNSEPISDVDVELRRVEGTPAFPLGPLVMPPGNFSFGAVVRPTYPNPSDIANARTKTDGKFVFTNLKPGTYRLQAARAGGAYFPAEYGQRNPRGKGYDFEFVEGQTMRDVRLPMAPTGSITGRVRDADGQPAARVRVMALEAAYPSGERTLGITQAVLTDDKGEYRLFWLPPGQYVIAARQEDYRLQSFSLFIMPPGSNGRETFQQAPLSFRTSDNGGIVEETFQDIYYGGDSDVKKARSVDLPPGGNLNGIDIPLNGSRIRTRHVRGTLLDPSGIRMPGVSVSALPRNSGPSMVAPTALTDANGTFDIAGVGPGAYTIRASLPGFSGSATLGPGDADVEGLTIAATLGIRVQGKIVVEGQAPGGVMPDISKISVRLDSVVAGLPSSSNGAVNGDTFTVNVPQPGDYRVSVNPFVAPFTTDPARRPSIPPDLQSVYVKAIRMSTDDGLNGTVNVASKPAPLEIAIAFNGGTFAGLVSDRQQPAANALVVLVPSVRSRSDLYRIATTSGDGRFRFQGITPGEYKVFAWEYVEDGAWFDAEFTRTRESKGKAVRITEGSNPDLSLTMERP